MQIKTIAYYNSTPNLFLFLASIFCLYLVLNLSSLYTQMTNDSYFCAQVNHVNLKIYCSISELMIVEKNDIVF